MSEHQTSFEGWAIVELLGHQQEIGFVTTQAFGQAVMFRIDQPELPEREITLTRPEWMQLDAGYATYPVGTKVKRESSPARSRLVSPGALYAINPCTEEAARAALEKNRPRAMVLIEMPAGVALPAPTEPDEEDADTCEECGEEMQDCVCLER